ncbi:Yos1-like protein [Chytridium lagenaria]|nr:Yos1-like protein [Chytridium lagenaria]
MALFLSLGQLIYVALLLTNAIAILHEDRFLARLGLSQAAFRNQFGPENQESVKYRVVQLLTAVRTLLRVPLIALNVLVIIYALIFG